MIDAHLRTERRADAGSPGLLALVERALQRGMQDLRSEVVRNWTKNNSIATGNLRRSAQVLTEQRGGDLVAALTMPTYALDVEFGTTPHRVPILTPEGGGLLRWVVAKGLVRGDEEFRGKRPSGRLAQAIGMTPESAQEVLMNPDSSKASRSRARKRLALGAGGDRSRLSAIERRELDIAYAMQAAIAKHGTPARPAIRPASNKILPRILDLVSAALRRGGL